MQSHLNYTIRFIGFISDLSILTIAIILGFYQKVIINYSIILFISICSIWLIAISLSLYLKLYYWRNLQISISSFFLFFINYLQFILYLWGLYLILFSLKTPIYLINLSLISQYRYLLLSIITISILIYILITSIILSSSFYKNLISTITYPYLKEEIQTILQTWNETIFSPIFSKIIDKFNESKKLLVIYFISYFIIFYIPRFIVLYFFINFIWFNGDLRNVIFMSPIFFIIWILSFLDYYFHVFFQDFCNYINKLISVRQINPVKASFGAVKTSLDNMTFQMKPYAFEEGFTEKNLPILIEEWHIAASLSTYLGWYHKFLLYIGRLLFLVQSLNGFYLGYFFFVQPYINSDLSMLPFFRFSKSLSNSTYNISSRSYAIAASRVKGKGAQTTLNHETEGVQSGNHPAIHDRAVRNPDNPDEIRYYGQATHGPGTPDNSSVPLNPTEDLQGNKRPQYYVPAKSVAYYKESFFEKKDIPGSEKYLGSSPCRQNLAKHTPQEEST